MTKTFLAGILLLIAVMALGGCSNDPNPVTPVDPMPSMSAALQFVPADAMIDSARIYLYVNETDTQSIQLHAVNGDWMEGEVTYAGFSSSFDASPLSTMLVEDGGWKSFDVGAQVQGWFDSTLDNFGFLLQPIDADTGATVFASREAEANQPYLEVFYTTHEGPASEILAAIADAYVYSAEPDANFGGEVGLQVQRETGTDSLFQTLVRFDFPVEMRPVSLGDRVWMDENADGLQDEGEPGAEGVTVNLFDCDENLIATTSTDASGYYLFDLLPAGDYVLEFVAPDDYVFSPMDAGDDTLDSDADPATGRTVCLTAMPGVDYTGWDAGLFTYDGCTRGKGYWKNHAGFGPQADELSPLLPLTLGDDGGDKSLSVESAETAFDLLQQHEFGHPSNGITKLYAHLLTTKLNLAVRSDPADVAGAVDEADAFLADHDWMDWESLDQETRNMVLEWKDLFEQYNEGEIGPGHCEDEADDDPDDM